MDNLVLYGPGGASPVQIGSWLDRGQGDPDYGARGLLHAIEAESFGDGGQFIYERAPIRHMSFPLIVGSGAGLGLSLVQIESLLRKNARPGGYIDVQPEGVASAESVRFDILHGRWEPNYSIYHNRLPRRQGNLLLDVQPFGYWPTVILLASYTSATWSDYTSLSWNPASIIGDAPAQAVLAFHASVGTTMSGVFYVSGPLTAYQGGQVFFPDGYWWSMARPSGATAYTVPADFTAATVINAQSGGSNNIFAATVASMGVAPFGAVLRLDLMPSQADQWKQVAVRQFNSSAAQLYAGRYRVYGSFRFKSPVGVGSTIATMPLQITLDTSISSYLAGVAPMASTNYVATLLPQVPSGGTPTPWVEAPVPGAATNLGGASEPGFQLIDFGEYNFPPLTASGAWSPWQLRLWAKMPTAFVGTYQRLEIAGLRFQALDGPAGILPNGMIQPSTNNIVGSGNGQFWGITLPNDALVIDGINNRVGAWIGSFLGAGSNIASPNEITSDVRGKYRGAMPRLVGTEMQLDFGHFDRSQNQVGATTMVGDYSRIALAASIHYRPRFQFLRGL